MGNYVSSLKIIREKKGLSRKEVSERSGVNLRSLQDYEQGHKDIASAKGETLYRLSLALGCTMEALLDIEPVQTEKSTKRLYSYYEEMKNLKRIIEAQDIFSSKYKVHGRWRVREKECYLQFVYKGEIKEILFEAIFSEELLPWLIDAAEMKIEYYIDTLEFNEKWTIEGGESWDE